MVSGALDEVATVQAISAISGVCTEEEWQLWVRPILEKRLRIPITITEFNKAAPKEYRITDAPSLPRLVPVVEAGGLPQTSIIEPYSDGERLLVLIEGKSTNVFLADGTPVHRMLPEAIDRFRQKDSVVVELIDDCGTFHARDVFLWDQFTSEIQMPTPDKRLEILDHIGLEVVDNFFHDGTTNPREDIATALQCGYPGLVFRQATPGFLKDMTDILVLPKRKSVLTCTRIEAGPEDSKYGGRVEYLWGKGRMNNKPFESPVFHGLTFADREQILEAQDEFVGKKFDVLSCGLDPNGKLIFPIFKQWKELK